MAENTANKLVGHNYTTPDLIAKVTGYVLEATGSYVPVFFIASSAYLVTLGIVHLLVPRLEPANLGIQR